MIDHDRLFKELLSTFFVDFIELFFPEVITYLEPDSVTFLDKEIFTDVTAGERHETDLVVQAQFRGQSSFFLIHLENQSESRGKIGLQEREQVMQIVTSWMEEGIEQGIERGRKEGQIELVLRMLSVKFGSLDSQIAARIRLLEIEQLEDLGVALLSFQKVEDLTIWLQNMKENSAN